MEDFVALEQVVYSSCLMDLLQVQPESYRIDFTAWREQGKKGKKGGMGCC